ncbi:MAG: metalloregulator ArsR/SmtB family transcription factor [Candidatus Lokiarchaeia archaeon]|nr:metalloregulator ArsR/SmtB family transcription factor [Candidatus Lokiarchaeia archaeon]
MKVDRKAKIKDTLCGCDDCTDGDTYFKNLQKIGKDLKFNDMLNSLLEFFNALGNKERLVILTALMNKERCVCELEAILDKSQPSISHHLRELEKAGLIRGWKKGKYTYYTLIKEEFKEHIANLIQEFSFE